MGLFGHKKHVYVFWCRFDDAEDLKSSNDMVRLFGTKEVATTIQKLTGDPRRRRRPYESTEPGEAGPVPAVLRGLTPAQFTDKTHAAAAADRRQGCLGF